MSWCPCLAPWGADSVCNVKQETEKMAALAGSTGLTI